ncbi:hypothetical protein [Mesorhizobium sp. B1-1-8]|uniref:hypothetical protein n=1 Tax=Mesorhizobium sp. B1-1-8 TaxID=2589976 RepID=UPI00112AC262|nr:hypothetical protein [Mesorhizobium sp. B1-1-8]UCI06273.1 hypothetical protein FJ974_20990 [Mesorhizobium sp. B1-1-8]
MTAAARNETSYYSYVFYLIGLALVEIRATEDLEIARILADIFHNVPAEISAGSSIEEIEAEMIVKAERHGRSAKISSMIEHAKRRYKGL